MPNRIIKESICTSDTVDKLTWFEEVVFYRLMVNCDDFGRFDGRSSVIRSRLFPLKTNITDKSMVESINKLSTVGLVTLYEYEGKPYLQLATWDKHQQVRAKKSKYPAFDSTCNQMISDDSKCPRNPIQSESESESEAITRGRFTPPTSEQVREYCEGAKIIVDAEGFCDFYTSKGWIVGNRKMVDWKAAARNWARRDSPKPSSNPFLSMMEAEHEQS